MKRIYNAIKIVLFFCIVTICIGVAAKVTENKSGNQKYKDFFELSDQVDVIFLGSSHMYNSINPCELFRDYGITGYNFAVSGGIVPESYWTLRNALDYCNPKLVVIDLWALERDYQYIDVMEETRSDEERSNSVALFHINMDAFPISKTKIETVKDIIKDKDIQKEFLFQFITYHARWSSLEAHDFTEAFKPTRGRSYLGSIEEGKLNTRSEYFEPLDLEQKLEKETVSIRYLKRLIEECQQKGIEVAFTYMPMATVYDSDIQSANTAKDIADEYGINMFELLKHEGLTVVDFDTDMTDDTHVNSLGMYKITSYIGNQLATLYDLPDHRSDPEYYKWILLTEAWNNDEAVTLYNATDIREFLKYLIVNKNINAVIFMGNESAIIDDYTSRELIKQLSGTEEIERAKDTSSPYLLILDRTLKKEIFETAQQNVQLEEELPLVGYAGYIGISNYGAIYKDANYENENLFDMEKHYRDDMQVILYDADGNELTRKYFNLYW